MKFSRTINAAIAMLLSIIMAAACMSCTKTGRGKDTPENNMLKEYPEVVEFNKNSVVPELMGTPRSEIGNGYECRGGVIDHSETYISSDNVDVTYTLGTREMHYENDQPADELYVTGIRVRTQDKKIETINGKRIVTYITDKQIMGAEVGMNYEKAGEKLSRFGYELIYEEKPISSLPGSLEISYRKGIIIISLAVESGGDVSSINAWIPYDTGKIDEILNNSHLPADLGLVYNCYASKDPVFTYYMKNEDATARVYKAEDGSVAVLHGYPDASDYIMCAQVTFCDPKYDIDGAVVGSTFKECIDKLTSAGWTLYKDGRTLTKGELTVKLFDVKTLEFNENPDIVGEDSKIVTFIRVFLPSPSRMERLNSDK